MNSSDLSALVHRFYAAFVAKDRAYVEQHLSEDFSFTSPLDDHLTKAGFFERCWPNSALIRELHVEKVFSSGSEAFVRYAAVRTADGVGFRNAEYLRFEGGLLKAVEVYFGPELPALATPS